MKNVFLFISLLFLIACDTYKETGVYIMSYIDLHIVNVSGDDLLDPNNPDSYKEQEIRIFYLINGKTEEPIDGRLTHPRKFHIFQELHTEKYRMRVYVNHEKSEEYPTTYIQWNDYDTDTLKFHFIYKGGWTDWDQMWYNDEYQNIDLGGDPLIEIVK